MPDRSLTWSISGARAMPSKPTWFQRLPEILAILRDLDADPPSAQAVEPIFG